MRRSVWIIIALFGLALALAWTNSAFAQEPTPAPLISDDQVNAIARQMYCPVCENTPLDVCPTQACAEWRELIRDKLAEGWTDAQIKQYFVDRFGDRVLASPPARGLNWLVYIIPPIAILLGLFLLYRAFRAMRQPGSAAPEDIPLAPAGNASDAYAARLEEELRKR